MSKWGEYLIGRAENWGAEDWVGEHLAEELDREGLLAITPAIHLLGRQLSEKEFFVRPQGTLFNALNLHAGSFSVGEYGRWDWDTARCIVLLPLRFAGSDYSVGSFQSRHDMGYSPVCSKVFRLDEPEDQHREVVDPEDSLKPPSPYREPCKCEISVNRYGEGIFMPNELAMLAGASALTEELLLNFGRAIGEIALEEGISKVINSVGDIDEALSELKSYYANNMLTFEE